jgi:hypothetical protein
MTGTSRAKGVFFDPGAEFIRRPSRPDGGFEWKAEIRGKTYRCDGSGSVEPSPGAPDGAVILAKIDLNITQNP